MKSNYHRFWLVGISCCLLSFTPREADFDRPAAVQAYIQKYRYLAFELNQSTGIPMPVILAVAGLESNWGNSELARFANNHFGMKTKSDWAGWQYCKQTMEYWTMTPVSSPQCFKKYPLIRASYLDFGRFITTRPNYQHLRNIPNWDNRAWAEGLKAGGYATDPDYAEKLLRIIWRYRLYEIV
jgi:flagellum-specific peptidoglycan hydrolase FlgJ